MMDQGTFERLHKLLEDRARSAMDGGDFGLAGQYARAVGELERWYNGGQQGEPPHEAGELLDVDLASLVVPAAAQPEAAGEPPPPPLDSVSIARLVRQTQPGNVAAQRTAWQTVQQIEPDNQEAQEELRKLDAQTTSAEFRAELAEYRSPLVSRDIREVDKARSQAQRLLEQVKIRAPELAQEAQATFDDLSKLRDDIMRASQGGTSSESSGKFEEAIAVYRHALIVEKLAWILDDQSEEYVETSVALARARKKFFDYQIERTNARYGDAVQALEKGADVALSVLEEAQSLLEEVEEGGEEPRKRIWDLLEKTRDQKIRLVAANELILKANNSNDPLVTHTLLDQTRLAYAVYPNIERLIWAAAELIARRSNKELRGKIDEMQAMLAALQASVSELHLRLTSK